MENDRLPEIERLDSMVEMERFLRLECDMSRTAAKQFLHTARAQAQREQKQWIAALDGAIKARLATK